MSHDMISSLKKQKSFLLVMCVSCFCSCRSMLQVPLVFSTNGNHLPPTKWKRRKWVEKNTICAILNFDKYICNSQIVVSCNILGTNCIYYFQWQQISYGDAKKCNQWSSFECQSLLAAEQEVLIFYCKTGIVLMLEESFV